MVAGFFKNPKFFDAVHAVTMQPQGFERYAMTRFF